MSSRILVNYILNAMFVLSKTLFLKLQFQLNEFFNIKIKQMFFIVFNLDAKFFEFIG